MYTHIFTSIKYKYINNYIINYILYIYIYIPNQTCISIP